MWSNLEWSLIIGIKETIAKLFPALEVLQLCQAPFQWHAKKKRVIQLQEARLKAEMEQL